MEQFMNTLFNDLASRVQVAVWSSMMNHNLAPLVEQAFGEYAAELAFVWDQQSCTQARPLPGMHKPLLRKDLKWLKQTEFRDNVPNSVLLIDDDPVKCTENPAGTSIHPSTWAGSWEGSEDTELLKMASYIRAIVGGTADPASPSARAFVQRFPYEDFQLPRGKRIAPAGGDYECPPQKPRQRVAAGGDAEDAAAQFEEGDTVEAYWPDDHVWLPATIRSVLPGKIRVYWVEDSSESTLPASYVRYPSGGGGHAAPVKHAGPKQPSPWVRMESRSSPGVYYYYNRETGTSQPDPPSPWQRYELPDQPGVFGWWNPEDGTDSLEKPAM